MSERSASSEKTAAGTDSESQCRRILVKTPFGRGFSESADLFGKYRRESPFNSCFVLPTNALVQRVIRGMLSDGIAVAKKAVCTPQKLAEDIVTQNHEYRLISDVEAKMILTRIIKSEKSYVESLSPTKEFSANLLNDLYTLIYSICEQRSDYRSVLKSDSEHPSAKNRALVAIIDRYLATIEKDRLVGPEVLYAKAAEFVANGNNIGDYLKDSSVILFGIYEPVPSLRAFLTAVSESARRTVYYIPYSKNKRICSDDGSWFEAHETAELSQNPKCREYERIFEADNGETGDIGKNACDNSHINASDSSAASAASENHVKVSCKCFTSAKSEISAIAEEIHSLIENGVSPSDIAISFPDPQNNLALLDEIFQDFNLKYSAYVPLSLANSPIVQSLMLIPRIISENFSPRSVGELFASPYFRLKGRTVDRYIIEKTAIAANIGNGLHSWESSLEWLKQLKEEKLADESIPEFKKNEIRRDIAEIKLITETVLPFLNELNTLGKSARYSEHIGNYLEFLQRYGLPYFPDRDGDLYRSESSALKRFYKLLYDLYEVSEQFFGEKISFQEFAGSLRASVAGCSIAAAHDSSAVQVLGMNALQSNGFEYIFLAGLVDGKLPLLPKLMPYLTESESKLLWSDKRREKIRWETFYFISALCSAECGLYLTTRASAGKDTLPSPFYIAAVERLNAGEMPERELIHSAIYSLKKAGRDIAVLKNENCQDENSPNEVGPDEKSRNCAGEILKNYSMPNYSPFSVACRINAETMRTGGYTSAYDGILSDDSEICAAIAEKFGEDYAFSPTSLEQYANCPFSFLLKHIYYLDKPVEEDLTLSSSETGNLIHESLAEFYTEWMKTHQKSIQASEKAEALELLRKITASKIGKYRKSGPAWDAMTAQILKDSFYFTGIYKRFIENEVACGAGGLVPAGFEVGFGKYLGEDKGNAADGGADSADGADGYTGSGSAFDPKNSLQNRPIRVRSSDGESLLIKGYIDRVDVTDGYDFAVIDYKTGGHPSAKDIQSGKALQLPLYIRAFEEISGRSLKGAGGCYYVISKKLVRRETVIYDGEKKALFCNSKLPRTVNTNFSEILDNSVRAACGYRDSVRNGIFPPVNSIGSCKSYCIFSDVCRVSEFRLLEHKLNTGLYNKGAPDAGCDGGGSEGGHGGRTGDGAAEGSKGSAVVSRKFRREE